MICLHGGCFEATWPLAIEGWDQDPEVHIVLTVASPNPYLRSSFSRWTLGMDPYPFNSDSVLAVRVHVKGCWVTSADKDRE
eukprot:s443_g38.t1